MQTWIFASIYSQTSSGSQFNVHSRPGSPTLLAFTTTLEERSKKVYLSLKKKGRSKENIVLVPIMYDKELPDSAYLFDVYDVKSVAEPAQITPASNSGSSDKEAECKQD